MTTDPAAIIARLTRLVLDADAACDRTERELAAAMADLDTAHRREAVLGAELIPAHRALAEQAQVIAALQHAAVLSHSVHEIMAAEIDLLKGERTGGIVVCVSPITGGRN